MARKSGEPESARTNAPMRIGLALSGGGFRASLYHLGTIRYLEEVGIMPRVEVVSTVSGGSILGAYYLVEMERKLRAVPECNRLEACDEIIRAFANLLHLNFRMRALVFYPFFHPVQTLLLLLRLRHSGDTMALEFERHLFAPELRIGDLPVASGALASADHDKAPADMTTEPAGTRILINTTSLITGRRVVLSRESDTGIHAQLSKSDPNNISLARAVGASAAVPGLFKPLRIGNDVLSDGGVVDNQGIESLLDYFEITDPELNLLPAQFRQRPEMRSTGILQAANRRKVLKLLCDAKGNGALAGFTFTHLAMNVKSREGRSVRSVERLPSEFVGPTAELRTDLDEFSRLERDALIYHGYTLMKHQSEAYGQSLLGAVKDTRPGPSATGGDEDDELFAWPPPFIALCNPSQGRERRAHASRLKIQRFLKIGQSAAFRDVRRFPLVFAALLVLFVVLGRYLTYLLMAPMFDGHSMRDIVRDRVADFATGVIPQVNIPFVIDLRAVETMFQPGGDFFGTIRFVASFFCIVLAYYVALLLYWQVKQWFNLPGKCERAMLDKLRNIPEGDHEAGRKPRSAKANPQKGVSETTESRTQQRSDPGSE